MPVEGATTIEDLDTAQPLQGDGVAEGDDHLRQQKLVLKNTFPGSGGNGFSRAILATEDELDILNGATLSTTELNYSDGVTSAIQTQLNAITTLIDGMTSVGSFHIGNNPNGIFPGTWTQLAEGTFLMNTVSSADPSGGSNTTSLVDANLPPHTHPISDPGHVHGMRVVGDAAGSDVNLSGTATTAYDTATDSNTTGISVNANPSHTSASFSNKPLYKGVEVWERTA